MLIMSVTKQFFTNTVFKYWVLNTISSALAVQIKNLVLLVKMLAKVF